MTPNIQLKSEKLKQSSRCFICLMPNILIFSTIQMFGIRQTNIQIWKHLGVWYLVFTALDPWAGKTRDLDIILYDH